MHTGDFRAYRDAKRAEQSGKPLPVPEPKEAAAEPGASATTTSATERPVSKRQQEINDHIRRATAAELERDQLREELARLKTAAPASRSESAPAAAAAASTAAAPAPTAKDTERYLTMPDAPKLDDFESFEKWNVAMGVFIADKRHDERQERASQQQTKDREVAALRERHTTFNTRIADARTADPTFTDRLTPEVLALKPFSALKPGEPASPLNAIAEELIDSPVAPQLMLHLSEHPDELQRLAAIRDPRALVREFGRLQARFEEKPAAAAAAPTPKTVPGAPAPPTTVSGRSKTPADPVKAALQTGDFKAYREAKRQAALRTAS